VTLLICEGVSFTGSSVSPGSGTIIDLSSSGLIVNGAQVAYSGFTAASSISSKRFVDSAGWTAEVDSTTVIGVAPLAISSGSTGTIVGAGIHPVTVDCPLSAGDPVKVGPSGKATKHTTSQTTIQGTITGEASSFTQPASATTLEILQAADVAADRGRGIVIEGSDGSGTAITETISLNATNTTTPVAGSTSFTKVSAVYTANGANLGTQAVTVRASGGGDTVCTLAVSTSELAADIPSGSTEAYCNELTITGPNSDTSFVTIVGVDTSDNTARERVQLNGASPSVVTTTTVFRIVSRICLGEFTNAATGSVKTNAVTDTAAMKCGVVVTGAASRGQDAYILLKPNA